MGGVDRLPPLGANVDPGIGMRTQFCIKQDLSPHGPLVSCFHMAWTPPIKRREKANLLNDKRFYRLLSEKCNFTDRDTLFLVYTGMVQVVAQELRLHKVARLPHLGDFGLVEQKPRLGWMGKTRVRMKARDVLKFYPKERFRRYFSKYGALK